MQNIEVSWSQLVLLDILRLSGQRWISVQCQGTRGVSDLKWWHTTGAPHQAYTLYGHRAPWTSLTLNMDARHLVPCNKRNTEYGTLRRICVLLTPNISHIDFVFLYFLCCQYYSTMKCIRPGEAAVRHSSFNGNRRAFEVDRAGAQLFFLT